MWLRPPVARRVPRHRNLADANLPCEFGVVQFMVFEVLSELHTVSHTKLDLVPQAENTEMDLDGGNCYGYQNGMSALRNYRQKQKLSQAALAELAGTSQPQIKRLEDGDRKLTKEWAERLAPHLGVTPQELIFDSPPPRGQVITNGPLKTDSATVLNINPPPEILGERDLPVFSAVEGGPGEMVVSTDPIDIVPRPWFIRNVKEAYAVLVVGESMVPVFKPGMMVIVNPKLPVVPGEPAIFVDQQHGGFRATVKELVRSTSTFWLVHQWNPPEGQKHEFKLKKEEWPDAYRVVGAYYR